MSLMEKLKAVPKKNLLLGIGCLAGSVALFVYFIASFFTTAF